MALRTVRGETAGLLGTGDPCDRQGLLNAINTPMEIVVDLVFPEPEHCPAASAIVTTYLQVAAAIASDLG
jgi:hypothetical protein